MELHALVLATCSYALLISVEEQHFTLRKAAAVQAPADLVLGTEINKKIPRVTCMQLH